MKVTKLAALLRNDGFVCVCKRAFGRICVKLSHGRLYKKLPVQTNKILFMTFSNRYECNPKYITEELLRRDIDCEIVWVVRCSKRIKRLDYPANIRLIQRETLAFFKELATAAIWVDNGINCLKLPFFKKPEQLYINTWHGSLGLKRIDLNSSGNQAWHEAVTRTGQASDYCLSNSSFETRVFKESYWPDTEILEYGHARNDILVNNDPHTRRQLRLKLAARYGLDEGCKWLLYAPTFHDDSCVEGTPAKIDLEKLCTALSERFGGEWLVLVRGHFHDFVRSGLQRNPNKFTCDVSDYDDIQEILLAVDAGITDYSSWCCDFVLTNRPCFLFAPNMEDYSQKRGFYYPLSQTPFDLCCTNVELMRAIASFDQKSYERAVQSFLKQRGCLEDGKAAKRAVDAIGARLKR